MSEALPRRRVIPFLFLPKQHKRRAVAGSQEEALFEFLKTVAVCDPVLFGRAPADGSLDIRELAPDGSKTSNRLHDRFLGLGLVGLPYI